MADENEVRIYNCLMREIVVYDRATDDVVTRIAPRDGPPPTLVHMAGAPNVIGSLFDDRVPVLDARFDTVMHMPDLNKETEGGQKICLVVNQLVAQFLSQNPHLYDAQKVAILSPNMTDAKFENGRIAGIYSFLAFPAVNVERSNIQTAVTLPAPAYPTGRTRRIKASHPHPPPPSP
jgi:hypothetical protein